MSELEIREGVTVDEAELRFDTSRSSGPGGQNVNKVETRVTLLFDLEGSSSLDADQKARIRSRLATRITRAGVLRLVAQKHRTQAANRKVARERFVRLLREALEPEKTRRPTRATAASRRRRIESKRRRSRVKELRRTPSREGP